MLPRSVIQNAQRIDSLLATMDGLVGEADSTIQNVFANHIVLAGAGYVENAVLATLSEYGRIHGNPRIARFVEKTIARNNSLNCDKISSILNQFDTDWWPTLESTTRAENQSAIDSLKTLRDQIAHGKPNGTGFITVRDYYKKSKVFVADFEAVINA